MSELQKIADEVASLAANGDMIFVTARGGKTVRLSEVDRDTAIRFVRDRLNELKNGSAE